MAKKSYSSSSGLISHPGKPLEDHLNLVKELSLDSLNEKPKLPIDKNILKRVIEIVTLSHDIGKSTSYFQKYINAPDEEKPSLKNIKESSHSLFGAVVSFFLVKEFLESVGKLNSNYEFLPYATFLACKRHHGNLRDFNFELILSEENSSILINQLDSIDKNKFDKLLNRIGNPFNFEWISKKFDNLYDVFWDIEAEGKKLLKQDNPVFYFLVHIIYSFLLDADKSEVAISLEDREKLKPVRNQINLHSKLVETYKQKQNWEKKDIDTLREEAFKEVLSQEINLKEKIYSINLPTGLGKTLTSLAFAFKLRKKINEQKNYNTRIIYSLPFMSIIDQNSTVFENILKANGIDSVSSVLLKHHHLSDSSYSWKKGEEDFEFDSSKILIEGWNSEIIVTTFIQFFNTLISNKNRSIRKFHRIAGSIIILDEIQTIPHKYWLLLNKVIKFISENFDTYFVFVTATEPLIFARDEIKSLVERKKYFSKLNRVKIKPLVNDNKTLKEFAKETIPEVLESQKRFLFIFNTIGSAKEFHKFLKESGLAKEEITFLSTHIVPKERLNRIGEIRDGKKRVCVTTQLVEAGVDIDFDIVYRDFAPLDSINQSAGRCNRNGISSGGEIRVVSLVDEKTDRSFASYIYNKNSILLHITKKILTDKNEIKESEFLELIDEYYKSISDAKSDIKSREILQAFNKLNYDGDNGIQTFELIEDDYKKVDIFIQLDKQGVDVWGKFLEINKIENLFERKKEFGKIKSDFHQYTVSVPYRNDLNLPATNYEVPFVSNSQLTEYYDEETGYKLKGETAIW